MILGAEDKLYALEYQLFSDVRDKVGMEVVRIQRTAKAIAGLDVFASLALVAERNHYVRPKVNEGGVIDIKGGRHPVVEQMSTTICLLPMIHIWIAAKNVFPLSPDRIWLVNPHTCARQL